MLLSLAIGLIFPDHRVLTFLLSSSEISRVPHRRIQSCLLETNQMAVQTCLVSTFFNLLLLSLSLISVTLDFDLPVSLPLPEVWAAACTNSHQHCVRTFRRFDTHPRSGSVLSSSHRNFCLSGFLVLSCHPSCRCQISLGRERDLCVRRHISFNQFQKFAPTSSTSSILEPNLHVVICTNSPVPS